jgi:hypothetical protein
MFGHLLKTTYINDQYENQCCGSEAGSESERIRAFLTKSEMFVPDLDSDPDSDPVPVPVIG